MRYIITNEEVCQAISKDCQELWLPNPQIIRLAIDKLLSAFEDAVQSEFLKVRWQEIQRFLLAPSFS